MDRDTEIWKTLLKEDRYFRYKEIKKSFPHLNDAQLSKSLRRLEKHGLLVRDIGFDRDRPINMYLAIDSSNPKIRVKIVDLTQWLYAIAEWVNEKDHLIHSVGIDLGELGEYIYEVNGELYLKWPAWITSLAKANKIRFERSVFAPEK